MRIALRYLWILGIFGLGLGTVYWYLSDEVVGAVALWFFGIMPLIVATWWTIRGTDAAVSASDDPDASPQDRAGHVVGSFPLVTAWPVFLAMGVIVIGASLVYGLILLPVGAALLVWALIGLARETPD